MWFEKGAHLKEYGKFLLNRKGIRIGFCSSISTDNFFLIPYFSIYGSLIASTRLRVNDIIYNCLNSPNINSRFFNPFSKYDILIFQKNFSKKALSIAYKFKKRHTRIILDINVNYFNIDCKYITEQQNKDILNFLKITDKIITSSNYLKDYILTNNIFSDVEVIPEIISDHFFKIKKRHFNKKEINFLYVGHADKAVELELIKNDLERLKKEFQIKLITICQRQPKINLDIKMIYKKYKQHRIHIDMLEGDIFLNPRDLSNPYNLSHSFTKIGYPMSVGIPVVASPVPSYLKSPAVICKSTDSWYEKIKNLIEDYEKRNFLGNEGIKYCKQNFSKYKIMMKYFALFNRVLLNP